MKFFVYGWLCKGDARPYSVPGQLRVEPAGADACARFDLAGIVHGQVRTFSAKDVLSLDKLEARPPHVYRRTTVILNETGEEVFAYEYMSPDFHRMQVVRGGAWYPPKRRR